MKKGKIVQVMGPVVDVEFEDNDLPYIKDALEVDNHGKRCVMEVAQHIGNNTVRCIMLAASEGLCKDMEVINTGDAIKVPVGDKTLGRLFNVVGETIDGLDSLGISAGASAPEYLVEELLAELARRYDNINKHRVIIAEESVNFKL